MIKVTKSGSNSTAIIIKDIAIPTVENVMECKASDKGNRTFHYKREAFDVFVEDGSYQMVVQVTAYMKAGTVHSIKDPVVDPVKVAKIGDTKRDAIKALVACGFTPQEAVEMVKVKGK